MIIEKRFKEPNAVWKIEDERDCIDRTEGGGYWKEGTVLEMLEKNMIVFTPFAEYRKKLIEI